jgi:CheY-like chemotaxis protein
VYFLPRIWTHSADEVRMPNLPEADQPASKTLSPATAPTLDILVVDDEPSIRSVVTDLLELRNHRPRAVESPTTALDDLLSGPCDLMITDILMPSTMDGLDLAVNVRRLYPRVRILVMSGHYLDLPKTDPRHLSVDGFISKPFSFAELMQGVNRVTGALTPVA